MVVFLKHVPFPSKSLSPQAMETSFFKNRCDFKLMTYHLLIPSQKHQENSVR